MYGGAQRVFAAICQCRTAALGARCYRCEHCDAEHVVYNSCRNRHCPTCQGAAAHRWLKKQKARVLPVPYFHIVFTLPPMITQLVRANRKVMFNILIRTGAQTLLTIAADRRRLGASIGVTAVLHTWNQKLLFHPHVHMLVPNGGFDVDTGRFKTGSDTFFAPVRVLARLFRRLFLEQLHDAWHQDRLRFNDATAQLKDAEHFQSLLKQARSIEWNVYAKPPFAGPDSLIKYLSRYTHRVAIANSRITDFDGDNVSFRYRKPKSKSKQKTHHGIMTLPANEFIRRFLLHVLPDGLHRIRHFGILANSCAKKTMAKVLAQINLPPEPPQPTDDSDATVVRCPTCHQPMTLITVVSALQCLHSHHNPRAPPLPQAA